MIEGALLVGAFGALIALPFLPGVIEYRWPRDAAELDVAYSNTRQPRHFGMSLRSQLRPFVDEVRETPAELKIKLRRTERLEVHDELQVPQRARISSLIVAQRYLEVGSDAHLREGYCQGDVIVHAGARLRGLAVDGRLRLGEDCKIERWIDSEGPIDAGRGSHLGVSASSNTSLQVATGCTFNRLWAMPVQARTATRSPRPPSPFDGPSAADSLVWSREMLSLPPRSTLSSPLVVHGDLFIGADSVIEGDIKAHGKIVLDDGVRIHGNVISRKSLTLGTDCTIGGNLFSERDIVIGARSSVGRSAAHKTVYASHRIQLFDGARVFGWIVAEAGGRVG